MHIAAGLEKPLRVYRVLSPDALTALIPEWELLDGRTSPRTPFTSPRWIALWWKHLRRRPLPFRDEFFCHVLRDTEGRLVAIAPLMRTFCPGIGPAAIRLLQFFGTDPSLTELRGVICRPEDHTRAVLALAGYFLQRPGEWDVFRWNGLRQPAESYELPDRRLRLIASRELPDYIIELPQSWDLLKAQVSSNMRKNVRKAYEFLERDKHRFVLRVIEQPSEVGPAVERFLALHAARSKAADMIDHPNKFTTCHTRAFLNDYLRQSAGCGELRLFELEIGGAVVASRLAFLLRNDLYLYYAGYDPAWKAYSIMTTLVCEIIQWAIAGGLRRVNLSTGADQSKLRWKPAEYVFGDALQISPTARGRIGFRGFRAYQSLSRARDRWRI